MSFISGPIPPYNNVPIQPQNYQPRRFVISDITLGQTTTITATTDMDYVVGQLIRLIIPPSYGSYQLNEKEGYVLSIPSSTQVVVSIDSSRNVSAFVNANQPTKAQILGIGDINSGVQNSNGRTSTGTYIQGSFINIS